MKKTKEFIEPTIKTYSSIEFDLEIFKFSTYQYEEKHNLTYSSRQHDLSICPNTGLLEIRRAMGFDKNGAI
jgi:hypothetical protein